MGMSSTTCDDSNNALEKKVRWSRITENNVGTLRAINKSIFPVSYNDKFYRDVLQTPYGLTAFGCLDSYVISAVCCRLEPLMKTESLASGGPSRVYIMTLGVLEAYRGERIGSKMLERVLAYCNKSSKKNPIDYIYLHVQTNNDRALKFYKRYGFEISETIENYYKNLSPPDCFLLKKSF